MLENMVLVSLPDTVNVGLCGKVTSGDHERRGRSMHFSTTTFNTKTSSNLLSDV